MSLLVLAALAMLKAGEAWTFTAARDKEQRLMLAGAEIREAIKAYYEGSPGSVKQYPPNLHALLEDRRYLSLRRYLRRIPVDPVTGADDWVVISAPDGGIMGVHSRSRQRPVRAVAMDAVSSAPRAIAPLRHNGVMPSNSAKAPSSQPALFRRTRMLFLA